jgi:hypothetical protein
MFIGHRALAFGAKKTVPTVSLGVLFLACQLADIVWPNLVIIGIAWGFWLDHHRVRRHRQP